jgi:hypothetical protein
MQQIFMGWMPMLLAAPPNPSRKEGPWPEAGRARARRAWARGPAGAKPLCRGRLVGSLLLLGLVGRLAKEGGRDRRAHLAKLKDLEDVPALDRLVLEERLGDLVQGGAALGDDRLRALVLLEMIRWISTSIRRAVSSETFSVRVMSRPRKTVSWLSP